MQKKNFYLSNPHIEYLEKESKKLDITMSEIIRRILDKHIEEKEED